ncbi:MAG: type II toxin-antitoxin system HicA family toxin [Planctomycetota bacterium]
MVSEEARQRGSHKQFKHSYGRRTTLLFHSGRDLSPIILCQVAKDIGMSVDAFLASQRGRKAQVRFSLSRPRKLSLQSGHIDEIDVSVEIEIQRFAAK